MRVLIAVCVWLCLIPVAQAQVSPLQAFLSLPWSLGINLVQALSDTPEKVYYIQVTAEGSDLDRAKQSAFRMAVERTVGTVIASETETADHRIKRDEIITYASGYVSDYKIVTQATYQSRTWVKMEIWVKHSAIANRLLSKAESTQNINGLRLSEQVASINYERDQGYRILSVVMDDYPARAYDIFDQTIETKYFNRKPEITIEFSLRYNQHYIRALWETLKNTSQSANPGNCYPNCQEPFQVYIVGRKDRLLFNRWDWSFGFTEMTQPQAIYDAMIGSAPAILLTMKDARGNPMYQSCHFWPELDGQMRYNNPEKRFVFMTPDRIWIDATFTHRSRVVLRDVPNVALAQTVNLEAVRSSRCPK